MRAELVTTASPGNSRDLSNALALLALSALRWKFGPQGWRVFISDSGRWWATTLARPVLGRVGAYSVSLHAPDAVDADTPAELAAKLRKRSAQ